MSEPKETKVSIVGLIKFLRAALWIGQAMIRTTNTDSAKTSQVDAGATGLLISKSIFVADRFLLK